MAFLHSVIGDNTIENREHLEKIGYTVYENPDKKYIHPYTNQYQQAIAIGWGFEDIPKGAIDCRNNDPLFQAVTAMRDDIDYMQLFISNDGSEFNLCTRMLNVYSGILCRKATLSELQLHFKRV